MELPESYDENRALGQENFGARKFTAATAFYDAAYNIAISADEPFELEAAIAARGVGDSLFRGGDSEGAEDWLSASESHRTTAYNAAEATDDVQALHAAKRERVVHGFSRAKLLLHRALGVEPVDDSAAEADETASQAWLRLPEIERDGKIDQYRINGAHVVALGAFYNGRVKEARKIAHRMPLWAVKAESRAVAERADLGLKYRLRAVARASARAIVTNGIVHIPQHTPFVRRLYRRLALTIT